MSSKWLFLPRGAGKTTELIRMADMYTHGDIGRYIVCADRKRVRHVADRAGEMGCDIHFPLTADEAMDSLGLGVKELLVDDADDILRQLFQHKPITFFTATEEPDDE